MRARTQGLQRPFRTCEISTSGFSYWVFQASHWDFAGYLQGVFGDTVAGGREARIPQRDAAAKAG